MPMIQMTGISQKTVGGLLFPLTNERACDTAYTVYYAGDFSVENLEIKEKRLGDGRLAEELKKSYVMENESAITEFLDENPNTIDYLREAPAVINKYFKSAQLSLEVFSDPEDEEGEQEIFINIKTSLSVKDAREFLEKIDDEWLLNLDAEILNIFNVGLKFV